MAEEQCACQAKEDESKIASMEGLLALAAAGQIRTAAEYDAAEKRITVEHGLTIAQQCRQTYENRLDSLLDMIPMNAGEGVRKGKYDTYQKALKSCNSFGSDTPAEQHTYLLRLSKEYTALRIWRAKPERFIAIIDGSGYQMSGDSLAKEMERKYGR